MKSPLLTTRHFNGRRPLSFQQSMPVLGGLLASLIVLAIAGAIDLDAQARFRRDTHAAVAEDVNETATKLTQSINSQLRVLSALAFVVAADPELDQARFELFSSQLIARHQPVAYLALARDDSLTHIYPTDSLPLSVDILAKKMTVDTSSLNMAVEGQRVVTGPFGDDLDHEVIVAREPIFVPESTGERFVGVVITVVRVRPLLDEAGLLASQPNHRVAVRTRDGSGGLAPIFGDRSDQWIDPEISAVSLPGTTWEVVGEPFGGWPSSSTDVWLRRGILVVLALAVGGATYLGLREPARLRKAVLHETVRLRWREEFLEKGIREQTQELAVLLRISEVLNSTLEVDPLVAQLLEEIPSLVDYTDARVFVAEVPFSSQSAPDSVVEGDQLAASEEPQVAEGGRGYLRLLGQRGEHSRSLVSGGRLELGQLGPLLDDLTAGKPRCLEDVWGDRPEASAFRQALGQDASTSLLGIHSLLWVPIKSRSRIVGVLCLEHHSHDYYGSHQADLALALASHAAVAIENAQLYEASQDRAATEERQRISRDLHDSVAQGLYSIQLGTAAARALIQQDPSQAVDALHYVDSLAHLALAEMRALLLELRPDLLAEEGLVVALDKQIGVIRARHNVVVEPELGAEPDLPISAKETIYRTANEALHNAVKHSRASTIWVRLNGGPSYCELEVRDDGVGFDPNHRPAGRLGLRSMRERAAKLGAILSIESATGSGTRVLLRVGSARIGLSLEGNNQEELSWHADD